jgi:signal transduction histidine kinase
MPEESYSVVIVDDEAGILSALKRAFRSQPYAVFTTTSAEEALAEVRRGTVKVFMTDYRMPGVTGVDLLRKVKEEFPEIMRILFTGYADIQVAEEAINKGEIYKLVNKPWNDNDLRIIIKEAVERFDLFVRNRQLSMEIKKQNEELVVLNLKLKRMYEGQKEFSSTVSHELRTPLAAISTVLEVLSSGTAGDLNEDQKVFLARALSNSERLRVLIDDILSLSKLESEKSGIIKVRNDLRLLVREVVETYRPLADKKGLALRAVMPAGPAEAEYDGQKINQVLANLVGNAIKFTKKGEITISVKPEIERNYIQVSVKDTGPGIKEADIPRLFQKFQQLESATERIGGTGLGLAICREIINLHGGKIWVESIVDRGSEFNFIVPVQEREPG